jgi:hypothetical protein
VIEVTIRGLDEPQCPRTVPFLHNSAESLWSSRADAAPIQIEVLEVRPSPRVRTVLPLTFTGELRIARACLTPTRIRSSLMVDAKEIQSSLHQNTSDTIEGGLHRPATEHGTAPWARCRALSTYHQALKVRWWDGLADRLCAIGQVSRTTRSSQLRPPPHARMGLPVRRDRAGDSGFVRPNIVETTLNTLWSAGLWSGRVSRAFLPGRTRFDHLSQFSV